MSSSSPARRLPSSLLTTLDSSTGPFLRAFALGFLASTVPSFARTLLAIIWTRKGASRPALLEILRRLLDTVVKGLSPRGLAFAGGIAVGGAKWGESCVEPLVRRVVVRVVKARRAKLRQSREEEGGERGEEGEGETEVVRDEVVAAVSTFVSSTIASLVALTLLQSSPSYTRPSHGRKPGPVAGPSGSPYPSLLDSPLADPSMLLPPGIVAPPPVQSPTLDLTLFVLVRAVDTMVRGVYASGARVGDGRAGEAVRFLARHADTLVFWLSSWRIMWCCTCEFLHPTRSHGDVPYLKIVGADALTLCPRCSQGSTYPSGSSSHRRWTPFRGFFTDRVMCFQSFLYSMDHRPR